MTIIASSNSSKAFLFTANIMNRVFLANFKKCNNGFRKKNEFFL
jgi:hypothetical protein